MAEAYVPPDEEKQYPHPTAQFPPHQLQPAYIDTTQSYDPNQNIDYTAPQQPYYDPNAVHQGVVPKSAGGPPNQGYVGTSQIVQNKEFVRSIPGIMNIVVIILLFFGWMVMVGWRGHVGSIFYLLHGDGSSFFFFTTVIPFFCLIGYVAMTVLGLDKIRFLNRINWNVTVMINCAFWTLMLVISCSIVARKVEKHLCFNHNCSIIETAAAFGFLSAFGMIGIIIYYFKRWKDGKPVHA